MHRIAHGDGVRRRLDSIFARAFATLAVAVVACGGSHEAPEKHREGASETRTAEAPDNHLRIDPEMLRDLRVTTSVVESRPEHQPLGHVHPHGSDLHHRHGR